MTEIVNPIPSDWIVTASGSNTVVARNRRNDEVFSGTHDEFNIMIAAYVVPVEDNTPANVHISSSDVEFGSTVEATVYGGQSYFNTFTADATLPANLRNVAILNHKNSSDNVTLVGTVGIGLDLEPGEGASLDFPDACSVGISLTVPAGCSVRVMGSLRVETGVIA